MVQRGRSVPLRGAPSILKKMVFVRDMEERRRGLILLDAVLKAAVTLHLVKVVVGHMEQKKESFAQ
jgi:hypothetical protein